MIRIAKSYSLMLDFYGFELVDLFVTFDRFVFIYFICMSLQQ